MTRESDILIRLLEGERAFVYTVRRGGETLESAVVPHTGSTCPGADPSEESLSAEEYYGGSHAMD